MLNKHIIKGKQYTIVWYVDNFKFSQVDKEAFTSNFKGSIRNTVNHKVREKDIRLSEYIIRFYGRRVCKINNKQVYQRFNK